MRLCSAHMLVLVASFLCGLGGCRNVSFVAFSLTQHPEANMALYAELKATHPRLH